MKEQGFPVENERSVFYIQGRSARLEWGVFGWAIRGAVSWVAVRL